MVAIADPAAIGSIFRDMLAEGWSLGRIAREAGISTRTVRRYIEAGRAAATRRLPRRLPTAWSVLFPADSYTPASRCDHDAIPIPRGLSRYCPICDRSGCDGHPDLIIRPAKPKPRKYGSLAARRWARRMKTSA